MKMPFACCGFAVVLATVAPAVPALAQSRGALLYSTHCIMSYRAGSLATEKARHRLDQSQGAGLAMAGGRSARLERR